MKQITNIILIALTVSLLGCSGSQKKELDNTFYCFNNWIRLPNVPDSMEDQVAFMKEIGFPGMGGHHSDDYFQRRAVLDAAGLKMPEIYLGITLTDEGTVTGKEVIKEIIQDSDGRDLLVALFLRAQEFKKKRDEGDQIVAQSILELADYAKKFNVKLAIYPHVNFYCETLEHTLKLVKMAEHENVGAIFNLCHFLKVEGEESWKEKLLGVLPYLFMVSIHGADEGDTREMGWDRLIRPLGEGTFDTYELVKFLKDNGYNGLFGLQCHNIQQDYRVALTQSMNTWKDYQKKYAEE